MSQLKAARTIGAWIVLIAGILLVHATTGEAVAQAAKEKKAPAVTTVRKANAPEALPVPVVEVRDAILAAVNSGRIDDLAVPIAWNELPPATGAERGADPIAWWKKNSADGEGRDVLALLASVIAAGHAVLPVGRDVENARLYVWPRFAEMDLSKLSPADEVQLYRLLSPATLKAMRSSGKWTWYRLVIGADGTWHSFQQTP